MTSIERTLRLHEENHRILRKALESAGGSLDMLLDSPLSNVLRTLAQNDIRIQAIKNASDYDEI